MQYQLLPDLTADEFDSLKADIAARGVMVPVELDETGAVLDGHHRVRACAELGITDYPRIIRTGMSEDEKREHVLALNLERRHLTRIQRQELAEKLREYGWSLRRIGTKLGVHNTTVYADLENSGAGNPAPAADVVPATVTGSDGKHYPAKRRDVVTDTPRATDRALDLLAGGAEPPKSITTAADLAQASRRQAAAEREQEVKEHAAEFIPSDLLSLYHGRFQDVCAGMEPESVGLIYTDPPYGKEWLSLWDDLGLVAARLLKPGGLLVAYTGKLHFPYCLDALAANLDYHWMCAVGYQGKGATVFGRRFWGHYRPLLVFRKGEAWEHTYTDDFLYQTADRAADQALHPWAQSDFAATQYIERLSLPGEVVLDPMCGSGVFVRAAAALGRRGIGVEADADRFAVCQGLCVENADG